MLKPHDQLTIVPNLHRARELRLFRRQVETYFERSERDVNDVPMDWEGAQAARSRINQMLPRVIQIVRAAGLGGSAGAAATTDSGPALGRVEVLQRIFSARYGDGLDQEIFDVLDMALGVYEGGRFMALVRTINPLHYAGTALAFVARAPRRVLASLGLWRDPRGSRLGPADLARLESVAARLAEAEELIDTRLAAALDRQALRHAEYSRELAELAERLDFAERVLARQEPLKRLDAPDVSDVSTPV
ncbi:MAG TPA: hypothetical protein VGQ17_13095 [Gemmatimonadales bacterium]|jgi:hypothetical protein|nr:hypothetical protein [Gemmatimonadales bacterium]